MPNTIAHFKNIDSDNFWRYSNNFDQFVKYVGNSAYLGKISNRPEHFLADWNIFNSESSSRRQKVIFISNHRISNL